MSLLIPQLMICPFVPKAKIRMCFAIYHLLLQLQKGDITERTLAWRRIASIPFIPVFSSIASELFAFLSPSCSIRTSVPGGASTKFR
jgi:hypothetical protein